jgi:hypothetical protein
MKFKLAIATISFIPALVLAQTAPNLLGTWKGVSNSTVMGIGGHHKAINKKKNEIHFNHLPFTLVVDRQEGFNFSGTFTSEYRKEILLGAISSDLQTGVMVEDDGAHNFKIVNANTIQTCYRQIKDPKIAACLELTKQ